MVVNPESPLPGAMVYPGSAQVTVTVAVETEALKSSWAWRTVRVALATVSAESPAEISTAIPVLPEIPGSAEPLSTSYQT